MKSGSDRPHVARIRSIFTLTNNSGSREVVLHVCHTGETDVVLVSQAFFDTDWCFFMGDAVAADGGYYKVCHVSIYEKPSLTRDYCVCSKTSHPNELMLSTEHNENEAEFCEGHVEVVRVRCDSVSDPRFLALCFHVFTFLASI